MRALNLRFPGNPTRERGNIHPNSSLAHAAAHSKPNHRAKAPLHNVRVGLALFWLLPAAWLIADERDAAKPAEANTSEELPWQNAFSPISAVGAQQKLVFLVITNDDPTASELQKKAVVGKHVDDLWCTGVLSKSLRKAFEQRPDLRDQIVVQSLRAGIPPVLTGGQSRNQPARALVAVCDGQYRLLGMTVGVPAIDAILTLFEDAQEVRSLMQMHSGLGTADTRQKLIAAISSRSEDRLSRLWREGLEEMMAAMGDGRFDDSVEIPDAAAQQQAGRLTLLAETYERFYLADVKLRFGLTEAADRTRLIILEQHPQTRRPWVESVLPFVAGEDFITLWRPLCETLWGFQPITRDVDVDELLQWWDTQIAAGAVVFSLQPSLMARREPWPPLPASGKPTRRDSAWNDVKELVVQFPYRAIDAQQLFLLIDSRKLKPVDIQRPTRARYLMFEPDKKLALVIREGDPPGRFVGRLKREK